MRWTLVFYVVFSQFLLLTHCAVQYHYGTNVSVLRTDAGTRISGIQDLEDKDIVLGGLLRVHKHNGSGKCGYLDKSLEYLEAILFAIDLVNNDPHLLPNITLGYDIKDTCISESIALDECVDSVLSSGHLKLKSCFDSKFNSSISTISPVGAVIGAIDSHIYLFHLLVFFTWSTYLKSVLHQHPLF